jgi:hypothetical protein
VIILTNFLNAKVATGHAGLKIGQYSFREPVQSERAKGSMTSGVIGMFGTAFPLSLRNRLLKAELKRLRSRWRPNAFPLRFPFLDRYSPR